MIDYIILSETIIYNKSNDDSLYSFNEKKSDIILPLTTSIPNDSNYVMQSLKVWTDLKWNLSDHHLVTCHLKVQSSTSSSMPIAIPLSNDSFSIDKKERNKWLCNDMVILRTATRCNHVRDYLQIGQIGYYQMIN